MGIGLQISFVGLPASARLETEAALQLLRLQPFGSHCPDCRLSIEALSGHPSGNFSARLEIALADRQVKPAARCIRSSGEAAIRCVFNRAVRLLQMLSAHVHNRAEG